MADLQHWERQLLPQGSLTAPDAPSVFEAFVSGVGDLLKAAAPVAEDVARAEETRRSRNDSATVAVKKPEAALAYRRIYADAVASAAEGAPDFVGQVQLATAEYNARLMTSLPESVRGPMLTYLEDLQISTMRDAQEQQAAADIALRARQASDAANAWTALAKESSDLLPEIHKQIRAFVDGQHLEPQAAAGLEKSLFDSVAGAALLSEATDRPEQFLANKEAGQWGDIDPARLALAAAQARQVLDLKKRQASTDAQTRAIGLRTRVQYAVDLYRSGVDFPGYAPLAQALKASNQTELLQGLEESRSDLGYAIVQRSSTPELLEKSHAENLDRAENAKSPTLAKMYRRHAAIDATALQAVTRGVRHDPLTFAVEADVVPPTEIVAPIFEAATSGDIARLKSAVGDRIAARRQVENHYDTPVGFLTPGERQKFVANYTALSGTDERVAVLETLATLPEDLTKEIGGELSELAGGDAIPLALDLLRDDPGQAYDVVYGSEVIRRNPGILPEKGGRLKFAIDNLYKEQSWEEDDPAVERKQRAAIENVYAAALYRIRGAYRSTNVRQDLLNLVFARVTNGRVPPS
jgi:hypothetical protein